MSTRIISTVVLICSLLLGTAFDLTFAGNRNVEGGPQVELGSPGTVFGYERTFGETGVAYPPDSDHLYYPVAVGVEGADNVWIVESAGNRAMQYDTDGTFLMSIGTAGLTYLADETHFAGPTDAAVEDDVEFWVVDYESSRVVKFDAAGTYLTQLGVTWETGDDNAHFDHPAGVALGSNGDLYVSDAYNHRVQVFGSNGFYSTTLGVTGVPGSDNGHFNYPLRIAVDDADYLYVADSQNHRIQIFDDDHNYVTTLGVSGQPGSDNGHLDTPRGVAVDADSIYVADANNNRVQIFDRATYVYLATLGSLGTGDYEFNSPRDVAVDSAGKLYVADTFNFRVQQYDSSLVYQHTFGSTAVPYLTDGYHYNFPTDVAVDSSGNVAIIEDEGRGHRLIKLDAAGEPQFIVGEAGIPGDDNAHFNDARGVEFDAAGNVYVADCANHRVQIFNSAGTWVTRLGTGWGTGDYEFKCPTGVALGSDDFIYVADSLNHRIQIYDDNRIYVATLGTTGVPGSGNNQFNEPQDVDVDAGGAIYVADTFNHRVQVFNSGYAWQMTLGISEECGYDFDHFCVPMGVSVDEGGDIYVSEYWNPRVQVFDSAGAYLTTIGGAWGSGDSSFQHIRRVDVDAAGNVYLADTLNHRVQKFAPGVPEWDQLNINGFGTKANAGVSALHVFNGPLYAGASNWEQGGRVWRSLDGITWEPASQLGFGIGTAIAVITDLTEFEGQLYAASGWGNAPGAVWRSADGLTWDAVTMDGFGDAGNNAITAFAIYHGWLYAGVSNPAGAQIWRSSSGDTGTWIQVAPDEPEAPAESGVTGLAEFQGDLYAAIEGAGPAQVWRSTGGSLWTAVVSDGFGDQENTSTGGFAEFDGALYVGSGNPAAGAQLWRSEDGVNWELAVGGGFGDLSNDKVELVVVFEGELYAGLKNPSGGLQLWRTADGSQWDQANPDGFGDSNNDATLWSNAMAIFECRLTIGTWNSANGGELWSMLRDGALCVDKSGPASAYYGDEVTYQMAVTYSSLDRSPAQNINVVDDHYGAVPYLSGDADGDGYLDASETWLFEASTTIGAPGEVTEDPIINLVTVTGQDMAGAAVMAGTDSHSLDILAQVYLPMVVRAR
jgi:hypothetical protein